LNHYHVLKGNQILDPFIRFVFVCQVIFSYFNKFIFILCYLILLPFIFLLIFSNLEFIHIKNEKRKIINPPELRSNNKIQYSQKSL